MVFQAHHKESDLNNGRKILIQYSNTGVGWGGAQTGLAIINCLIKEKRQFLLFYEGGIISCYLKEMLIPIKANFVLSGMLPSQQLNLKSKVNLGASLCLPAAVF